MEMNDRLDRTVQHKIRLELIVYLPESVQLVS